MTLDPLTYNYLGIAESAGCVRLLSGDAKWVYGNCAWHNGDHLQLTKARPL